MNPKLKRPLFKLINQKTKSVDIYHQGGSMWLIFTDEKKWVIELTKDGTLWYNHYFFQDCFKYLSLDVVENQHYITEWVEDIIQNGVKHTAVIRGAQTPNVEDTIKNGVRYTDHRRMQSNSIIEDTIQNGIKETNWRTVDNFPEFEERVIQNGIKETWGYERQPQQRVDQVIEQGTKEIPSL